MKKQKKLFIANLPKNNCTAEDLEKYFKCRHPKKYGIIEKIQLIKKKDESGNTTNENKGYGFIEVSTEDLADKMAIQHQLFEFQGRKIELKKSVPNSDGGKGGRRGGRGGGNQFAQNQQFGGYGYGGGYGPWDGYQNYGGYGGDYYGYGGGYGGGYVGGPQGGNRGRGRGAGNRYQPY